MLGYLSHLYLTAFHYVIALFMYYSSTVFKKASKCFLLRRLKPTFATCGVNIIVLHIYQRDNWCKYLSFLVFVADCLAAEQKLKNVLIKDLQLIPDAKILSKKTACVREDFSTSLDTGVLDGTELLPHIRSVVVGSLHHLIQVY